MPGLLERPQQREGKEIEGKGRQGKARQGKGRQGKARGLASRVRCGLCLYRQGNKKITSRGEKCQRNKIGMVKEGV